MKNILRPALVIFFVLTLVTGGAYTLLVTGIAKIMIQRIVSPANRINRKVEFSSSPSGFAFWVFTSLGNTSARIDGRSPHTIASMDRAARNKVAENTQGVLIFSKDSI